MIILNRLRYQIGSGTMMRMDPERKANDTLSETNPIVEVDLNRPMLLGRINRVITEKELKDLRTCMDAIERAASCLTPERVERAISKIDR